MRVAAPRPNTLPPLQRNNQPPQRIIVEVIADFHSAAVGKQHRQSRIPIRTEHRNHGGGQRHLDQWTAANVIGAWMNLRLQLFLQVTIQRVQRKVMTPAELTATQPAGSVRTC